MDFVLYGKFKFDKVIVLSFFVPYQCSQFLVHAWGKGQLGLGIVLLNSLKYNRLSLNPK